MENGRTSQKLSLRPRISERRENPRSSSPVAKPVDSPKETQGVIRSLFGERSLLFLGIISSILALTVALWSIHKNSDITKRLNHLHSSVVDLIVKQKAAPVVEVGRRDITDNPTKLELFRERRETKKKETPLREPLIENMIAYNQEMEQEQREVIQRIKRESEENIRRMEIASREALAEGEKHKILTNQIIHRVGNLQVQNPEAEEDSHDKNVEKIFGALTSAGEAMTRVMTGKKYIDDIDIDDLERDLRLLTDQ